MAKIPNPLSFITKPVVGFVQKRSNEFVGRIIADGTKAAARNLKNDFLATLSGGVKNIGTFAGDHKKQLALGGLAAVAMVATKNMLWPAHSPAPPPPPETMIDNLIKFSAFAKDNWKIIAPILGVGAVLLSQLFSSQGPSQRQISQNDIFQLMEKGLAGVQFPTSFEQPATAGSASELQEKQQQLLAVMGRGIGNIQGG